MSDETEIRRLLDRYVAAYRAGDSVGCAAAFTEDGELRSPFGPAAVGRDAIARIHAGWVAEGGAAKRMDLRSWGMSGDIGWCLAAFAEGEQTGEGEPLCVLQRQPGGGWLIRMCSLTP